MDPNCLSDYVLMNFIRSIKWQQGMNLHAKYSCIHYLVQTIIYILESNIIEQLQMSLVFYWYCLWFLSLIEACWYLSYTA